MVERVGVGRSEAMVEARCGEVVKSFEKTSRRAGLSSEAIIERTVSE
jgi:hypothetical protein